MFGRSHLGTTIIIPVLDAFQRPNGAIGTADHGGAWLQPVTVDGGSPGVVTLTGHVAGSLYATRQAVALLPVAAAGTLKATLYNPVAGPPNMNLVFGAINQGAGAWDVLAAGVDTATNKPYLLSLRHGGASDFRANGAQALTVSTGDVWAVSRNGPNVSMTVNGVAVVTGQPPADYLPIAAVGMLFDSLGAVFTGGFTRLALTGFAVYP